MKRLQRKARAETERHRRTNVRNRNNMELVHLRPDATWWRGQLHPTIRRVTAVVAAVPAGSPFAYQAPLAGQVIAVVEVIGAPHEDSPIYLYDYDASSWEFVTRRRGTGALPLRILVDRVVEVTHA